MGTRPRRPGADRGATAVEYALLVAMIALVIIAGVTTFGEAVRSLFDFAFPETG